MLVTITTGRSNVVVNVGQVPVNLNSYVLRTETGLFYPASNPSGFITETGSYYPISGLNELTLDQQTLGYSGGRLTINNSGLTFVGEAVNISSGNLSESNSSVLTITSGTSAVIGAGTTIEVKQSSATQNGYLSSGDWTKFNNNIAGSGAYLQQSFDGQTGVNVVHSFGYYPVVQVIDSNGEVLVPLSIINNSLNDFTVGFSNITTGYIIATLGTPSTGQFATTGWIDSEYYPRTDPSGFGKNISSYSTLTTGVDGLITINFSGSFNQQVNMSTTTSYTVSGQNYPSNGSVADVLLFIYNTATGNCALSFPTGWINIGGGWPTGCISGKSSVAWLQARDSSGTVIGAFNTQL